MYLLVNFFSRSLILQRCGASLDTEPLDLLLFVRVLDIKYLNVYCDRMKANEGGVKNCPDHTA